MPEPVPYWLLIAVLQSNVPLTPALSSRLYQAARDLYKSDQGSVRLAGDLAMGEVRSLKKDLLLGSIAGPGFEADLDTPHGSGKVRFILTRQGLEEPEPASGEEGPEGRPRSYAN